MIPVKLTPFVHRNQESIGIYFDNYPSVNAIVKTIAGVKWSQTKKCWYIACNKESYTILKENLNGRVSFDNSAL